MRLQLPDSTEPRSDHRPRAVQRHVFVLKSEAGKEALDAWIAWAQRCRIPEFVGLQRRIRKHRDSINAALEHGLSQGLIESTNTKLRVLARMAFGFR
jgi:transposase